MTYDKNQEIKELDNLKIELLNDVFIEVESFFGINLIRSLIEEHRFNILKNLKDLVIKSCESSKMDIILKCLKDWRL